MSNKKNINYKSHNWVMALGDLFAIIIGFVISFYLSPAYTSDRFYPYIAIGLAILISFTSHGHYTQRIPWWNQIRLISFTSLFAIPLEAFLGSLLEMKIPLMSVIINWLAFLLICICLRQIYFRLRARSQRWNMPTVVIGDSTTVSDILYAFNADPSTGYSVHTVLLRDNDQEALKIEDLPKRYSGLDIKACADDCLDYIAENPNDCYVIVLDTFQGTARDLVIDKLNEVNAHYSVVPAISRMSLYEMEPRYFFGYDVMLLQTRTALSHPLSRLGKRLLDIFSSLCGLIVFSPMFALIIAALKIEGHKGALFYCGERVGQNGEFFKCWKFQTMVPDSEHVLQKYLDENPEAKAHWEKYLKLPKDPRVVTKTAHFLRKSSLDEIPQLWNVFIGNMSLVGPRPILPREVEAYGDSYKDYIAVKPGITGLWQVSGRNSMSFQRRISWDSWYVRNWSFWGDIVIILKTIPAVLLRDDGH